MMHIVEVARALVVPGVWRNCSWRLGWQHCWKYRLIVMIYLDIGHFYLFLNFFCIIKLTSVYWLFFLNVHNVFLVEVGLHSCFFSMCTRLFYFDHPDNWLILPNILKKGNSILAILYTFIRSFYFLHIFLNFTQCRSSGCRVLLSCRARAWGSPSRAPDSWRQGARGRAGPTACTSRNPSSRGLQPERMTLQGYCSNSKHLLIQLTLN